jgi:hypothetical protein
LVVAPFGAADGSGNGIVGPEDYVVWRRNFGREISDDVAPQSVDSATYANSDVDIFSEPAAGAASNTIY